jgi:hypothetical protein
MQQEHVVDSPGGGRPLSRAPPGLVALLGLADDDALFEQIVATYLMYMYGKYHEH